MKKKVAKKKVAKRKVAKKKVAKKKVAKKTCFVVSPIGRRSSAIRNHADEMLNKVIRPVMRKLGYEANRIDTMSPNGLITDAIARELLEADVVVVILTDLNPNCMFEMGVRAAYHLPMIPMVREGTKLPFDVGLINTIHYRESKLTEARRQLRDMMRALLDKKPIENRVFLELIESIGQTYSTRAVYRGIVAALQAMVTGLQHCLAEVEAEFDPSAKDALKALADLFRPPFATLGAKNLVFEYIAKPFLGPEDPRLLAIVKEVAELLKEGERLDVWMRSTTSTDRTVKAVRKRVEPITERAKRIARDAVRD